MRSSWNPKPADLAKYASDHVEFEIRMLLQQFGCFEKDAKRPHLVPQGQACLEALLSRLRSLDDFLGSAEQGLPPDPKRKKPYPDDVFARHWNRRWTPTRFLTSDERRRINKQLAHLTAHRLTARWDIQPADLPDMVERACVRLDEFFRDVAIRAPTRLAAFSPAPDRDAPRRVQDFLHRRNDRAWAK